MTAATAERLGEIWCIATWRDVFGKAGRLSADDVRWGLYSWSIKLNMACEIAKVVKNYRYTLTLKLIEQAKREEKIEAIFGICELERFQVTSRQQQKQGRGSMSFVCLLSW